MGAVRVNVPAGITFCSKMKSPVIRHGNPHAQVHTLSVSTDRKINSTERDFDLIFIRLAHSTSQLDPQILVRNPEKKVVAMRIRHPLENRLLLAVKTCSLVERGKFA